MLRKSAIGTAVVHPLAHAVLVVVLGVLIYGGTLDGGFVFDDSMYITGNPSVHDASYLTGARSLDSPTVLPVVKRYLRTRWITYGTFWANYRLGGLEAAGYRAVNIFIHVANALLFYLFICLTFRSPALAGAWPRDRVRLLAGMAALLFVAHPVQTEAITYVTQRSCVLATTFSLACLLAYAGSRLDRRRARAALLAILAILCSILAMFSKEISFTLPLVVVLYEALFLRGRAGGRALQLIPLLATMLVIPLLYVGEHLGAGGIMAALESSTRLETDLSRSSYLFTQLRVMLTYLRLLILPVNQSVDHAPTVFENFLSLPVFVSFVVVAGIAAMGAWLFRRRRTDGVTSRLAAFCIFWFFLALSVESTLIPISELMFEYRLYYASAAACLAAAVAAIALLEGAGNHRKKWVQAGIALIIIVLAVAARLRTDEWSTGLSLWGDAVAKAPGKARPHNNLGQAYHDRGMMEEALREYQEALRLDSDYQAAQNNLAVLYLDMEQTESAMRYFTRALSLNPNDASLHYNVGVLFLDEGALDKAEQYFRQALSLKPDYGGAFLNLGNVYRERGASAKALEMYRRAVEAAPDDAHAHYNVGVMLFESGRMEEAEEALGTSQRLGPTFPQTYLLLGDLYRETGRREPAEEQYTEGLKLQPGNAGLHYGLGILCGTSGRLAEAIEHLEAALRKAPSARVHNALGNVYSLTASPEQAIRHYEEAIALNPTDPGPHQNLASLLQRLGRQEDARQHVQRVKELQVR